MKIIRQISKPAAILLVFHMLLMSGLSQTVWAVMIDTESIIVTDQGQSPREYLNSLLAREEIRAALISHGVDPQEATHRIDNLSDDEIAKLVDEIDQLPAGSGFFEAFLIVVFLAFVILLITDISGHTDVFPFVKKQAYQKTIPGEKTVETASIKQSPTSIDDKGINPADNLIIYFNPDSNDLTAKAYEGLDRVVKFMAKAPKTRINIIGFSDSTGSSSYDVMLSESRANTVKNYLIAKGVGSKKISTLGMGSEGFSATSGTEKEKQMIGGAVIEFKNR